MVIEPLATILAWVIGICAIIAIPILTIVLIISFIHLFLED